VFFSFFHNSRNLGGSTEESGFRLGLWMTAIFRATYFQAMLAANVEVATRICASTVTRSGWNLHIFTGLPIEAIIGQNN
jgi:hypothetical protein